MADLSKEPCYKAYLHKGAKGEIDWPEYNEETFEVDDGDGNTKTITGVVIYPREVFCRVEDCPSGSPDHDAIRRYARLHHGKRSPCGVCRKRNSGLGIKCGQRPYCEHWNLFKVTSSINGKGVDQSGTSSKPVPDQSHNAESDDGEEGAAGDTECHGDKESEGPDDADADADGGG
ncbi:uncharacterized protein ATNIH1004_003668 [Aspergillus tanneri]|uniref:Uncharacterized protein n=1 Tax=Aspergillus tanneri TaxID=1220188 RepID=A0A5M9N8S9_9EURO|nr:uncharacterized protein ATNIH1004_003668 [Aspergillus tanneri]KAA8650977.1 hypothetical protein ATNIH1004_003668 [Aspergillus tanneri]